MNENQQFRVILFIVFLGFIGISIPYLIFPALFLNPEYSIMPSASATAKALLLGVTLAAYPFGQFIGSPILGSLSDDYGRKKILTASLWIAAICYLLTGFAIKWAMLEMLIFSRFAAGLMEGNIAIARAMSADLSSLSKHRTFGRINAAVSIAYLLGPFLGGLMSDKNIWSELTLSTPFYFICILFILLAFLSSAVLKATESRLVVKQDLWSRFNLIRRMGGLFKNKQLKYLMLSCTAFTLAVDIFYEFGPVYLTVKWGLGPAELIYYNMVLCFTLALANGWLANYVSTRLPKRAVIIYSILGFSLFQLGVVWVNSQASMLTLFALSGLVIGVAVTLLTVKISDSVANNIQGEVLGVQVSLRVLGDAIICLFGGVLLLISPKIILAAAAMLGFGAMIYYARKT